jgi:hypothetical protein
MIKYIEKNLASNDKWAFESYPENGFYLITDENNNKEIVFAIKNLTVCLIGQESHVNAIIESIIKNQFIQDKSVMPDNSSQISESTLLKALAIVANKEPYKNII